MKPIQKSKKTYTSLLETLFAWTAPILLTAYVLSMGISRTVYVPHVSQDLSPFQTSLRADLSLWDDSTAGGANAGMGQIAGVIQSHDAQIKTLGKGQGKSRRVRVTAYSEADSCHYPDGKGGCLTASGKVATAHRTVACPRDMKLGTVIELNGQEYVCEDRYAKWVQAKHGDTIDVFVGYGVDSLKEAKQFGRKTAFIYAIPPREVDEKL